MQPDLSGSALSVTLAERGDPELLGRPPWWQRAAGAVRAALRRAVAGLPDQERGLLPGLVDGDTSNLDPVLAERFKLAGLTHLVAVSGTNCSLVIGAALLVLRRARARPWLAALVGAVGAGDVRGRRAAVAERAAGGADGARSRWCRWRPGGRGPRCPRSPATVLALLVWDPTLSGSASFAMSALATAALLVIAPGWARALRARGVPIGLAEAVAVAAAAHVVTAPVIAAISGRVSLVAIPANVLAEPVVARHDGRRVPRGGRRAGVAARWRRARLGRRVGRAAGWCGWPTSSAACTARRSRGRAGGRRAAAARAAGRRRSRSRVRAGARRVLAAAGGDRRWSC